jgi:hypothetical protein|tara:strand:- start:924 stop:1988 length:1065 start_codon:yes stop_codon:yes gene_type:complete
MVARVQRYDLDTINRLMYEGFDYQLDSDVIETIQMLSDQVGSPEYIRTPQFPKNNRHYEPTSNAAKGLGRRNRYLNNGGNGDGGTSDADWNRLRQFQSTKIVKREGVDGTIDIIRKHLNKICEKNYTNQRDNIFQELHKIVEKGNINGNEEEVAGNEEEVAGKLDKVGCAIFSIASGNKFYSEMYARLYKELMEEFPVMKTIFNNNLVKFRGIFNTIEFCNSEKDYDKFCAINKDNERRRATAMFYVNLMNMGIISVDEITTIISELLAYQMSKIIEADNKHIVDELSEVIFIMIVNTAPFFQRNDVIATVEWVEIIDFVRNTAAVKVSDYPSITPKSIFKYMDIVDDITRGQK